MDSFCENFLSENPRPGDVSIDDLIHKKVYFREDDIFDIEEVLPNLPTVPKASWNDTLVGRSKPVGRIEDSKDFKILDCDIRRLVVNDTPFIEFSDRINQIFVKEMATTIVLKLLGHSIGFMVL